jgi:dTDP-glucose 4,6-dehydratase
MDKKIIITGGAGFIGVNLVNAALTRGYKVLVIDKLTYAGFKGSLDLKNKNLFFKKFDICNKALMKKAIIDFKPNYFYNLAAESHVDRSIDSPEAFINTNIIGTFNIIECIREASRKSSFKNNFIKFIHVSTDEVYGSTSLKKPFTINTPYDPSSPYSSSKAASDLIVKAWCRTYDLPFLVTNCSNNFGAFQFPEKLIPHIIILAMKGKNLPIYGDGLQRRDWIHVDNHVEGILKAGIHGSIGSTYLFGTGKATTNLQLVKMICNQINKKTNRKNTESLIKHVADRPAHDRVYLIDPSKSIKELGWHPDTRLKENISLTIDWYLENPEWILKVSQSSNYDLSRMGKKK